MSPVRLSIQFALAVVLTSLATTAAFAQEANYDESKVPQYTLPDPLVCTDGTPVKDAQAWQQKRRPEILKLFEEYVYGKVPGKPQSMTFTTTSVNKDALNGLATRKEVTVYFTGRQQDPNMTILIYLPNKATKPVPLFVGLNFQGNHAISADPGITLARVWAQENRKAPIVGRRATADSRAKEASRWPVERILERGYGLATIYYGDIDPDFDDGFQNGVHPLFYKNGPDEARCRRMGLDRRLGLGPEPGDGLLPDRSGHQRQERGGHGPLPARQDRPVGRRHGRAFRPRDLQRLRLRRGRPVAAVPSARPWQRINTSFPHWFCTNFKKYNGKEGDLPVDQHDADRPDRPAAGLRGQRRRGPLGRSTRRVPLRQARRPGLQAARRRPACRSRTCRRSASPRWATIAYHIRPGKHDVTTYDWDRYMDFADKHLKNK